jgi:hypothetical protein
MIEESRKAELRPIYKQGSIAWLRMFNKKEINAEELLFLTSHWESVKGRKMMQPPQQALLKACKDCRVETDNEVRGELICPSCWDLRVNKAICQKQ